MAAARSSLGKPEPAETACLRQLLPSIFDNVRMHTYSEVVRKTTNLDLCNCFATRQAARHVTRLYERHLADAEITSAQFSILVLLDENRGMTMNELATALVMDRTTLLRALKPLQREELVSSKRSDSDPRQLVLALSAAGQRKLKEAIRLWRKAQTEFESQLGSGRAARLRSELLALARAG
jgi:DNA-binding MarR family transcriptional regulator